MSLGTDGVSQAYTYYRNPQNTGNLSWVRFDGNWYYPYDQAGNTIVKAKALVSNAGVETPNTSLEYWNYGWDLNSRLIEVKKKGQLLVSYLYDAENFRVQRIGSDGTTIYTYGRDGALTYQKNLTTGLERSFTYLNDTLIGWTETKAGIATRFYVTTDQLGSVTQVLSADAANPQVLWQSEYTAFGTMAGAEGGVNFDGMYTGKDIDSDTGLTYHWNRWRSEDGSRFWSEDPARDGDNWYAYVRNSPLLFVDPTGLEPWANGLYSGSYDPYYASSFPSQNYWNMNTFSTTSAFDGAGYNNFIDYRYSRGEINHFQRLLEYDWVNNAANKEFTDTFRNRFDKIGSAYEQGGLFPAIGEFLGIRNADEALGFAQDAVVAVGLAAGSAAIERMVANPTWWNGLKNLFQRGGGGQTSTVGNGGIGFAQGTVGSAFQGMRSGGGHAMRHLIDEGLIPNAGSLQSRTTLFENLTTPILTKPTAAFDWKLGDTMARAFAGQAGGRNVVVFVAKEGAYQGKVLSAIVPDAAQMAQWGLR